MSHFNIQELGFVSHPDGVSKELLQEASFMKSRKVRIYEMGGAGAYLVTRELWSEILGLHGPEALVFVLMVLHVSTCLLVVHVF